MHLRGAARPMRPQGRSASRHRRNHPRYRSQGRQVRANRGRRHPNAYGGDRRGDQGRRAADRAWGRSVERTLGGRSEETPIASALERATLRFSSVTRHTLAEVAIAEKWKPQHGVPLREAFWVWLRVAALSFGGPAGQIAVMHRILVEEKRWVSDQRFLHALNYCMLLPGPEAQQLATYIGWLMHRTLG